MISSSARRIYTAHLYGTPGHRGDSLTFPAASFDQAVWIANDWAAASCAHHRFSALDLLLADAVIYRRSLAPDRKSVSD